MRSRRWNLLFLSAFIVAALFQYPLCICTPGDIVWEKTYGGLGNDSGWSVQATPDGSYIIAGSTTSFGAGNLDVYLVKVDGAGNKVWEKTYGGTGSDYGYSVQVTSDGGYIIAGSTTSFGAGGGDVYLVKVDGSGNLDWEKTYGGTGIDIGYSVQVTSDGGYIVAGYTDSFGAGGGDVFLVKVDGSGNKMWEKTYGGTGIDYGRGLAATSDGGYIVAGYTDSSGAPNFDVYLVKANSSGNKIWEKTYGGRNEDIAYSISQASDGYLVAGVTSSFGAGGSDIYLIQIDDSGNKAWEKTYGGTGIERSMSAQTTSGNAYIILGSTSLIGGYNVKLYLVKMLGFSPVIAPSSLAVFSESSTSINLTWTDNGLNVTNFRIERKLLEGTYTEITSLSAGVTSYTDTLLTPNTEYTYRVRAYRFSDNLYSSYSKEITASTPRNPPLTPTNLRAESKSSTSIYLTWIDGSSDESGFKVERKTQSGAWLESASLIADSTSYMDSDISAGTTYTYRVRAYRAVDTSYSAYSNEATATTLSLLRAPNDLTALPVSHSKINLTWADNSLDETGFHIERRTPNGTFTEIKTLSAGATSYTDTPLTPNTVYMYRVRAYRVTDGTFSTYSNEANATTLQSPPLSPSNLKAETQSTISIQLIWADNSLNESNYKVERSQSGVWSEVESLPADSTGFTDTKLTAGTSYSYKVRAYRNSDNSYSEYSNEVIATTKPMPTVFSIEGSVNAPSSTPVLVVDNVTYTLSQLPLNLEWATMATHSFAWSQELAVSSGERYIWAQASGLSGSQSGQFTVNPVLGGGLSAEYRRQYKLTIVSQHPATGAGWFDEGSTATVTAHSPEGFLVKTVFSGWTGDLSSKVEVEAVLMDSPKTLTAVWALDYTVALISGGVAVALTAAGAAVFIPKRKAESAMRARDNAHRGVVDDLRSSSSSIRVAELAERYGLPIDEVRSVIDDTVKKGDLNGSYTVDGELFYPGSTLREALKKKLNE